MQPKKRVPVLARRGWGEILSCREQAGITRKREMNGTGLGINWSTSHSALVSRSTANAVTTRPADHSLQRSLGIRSMIH